MKKLKIKKGHILQRKGELNSKVYRVGSGLMRSYTLSEKGKEHTFMFAPEGWIIADTVPPNEPCDLFIDAPEDSIIWQIEKDPNKTHDQAKLIKRMGVLQKRVIMLMSASALKRYEHFESTYPEILQRVP